MRRIKASIFQANRSRIPTITGFVLLAIFTLFFCGCGRVEEKRLITDRSGTPLTLPKPENTAIPSDMPSPVPAESPSPSETVPAIPIIQLDRTYRIGVHIPDGTPIQLKRALEIAMERSEKLETVPVNNPADIKGLSALILLETSTDTALKLIGNARATKLPIFAVTLGGTPDGAKPDYMLSTDYMAIVNTAMKSLSGEIGDKGMILVAGDDSALGKGVTDSLREWMAKNPDFKPSIEGIYQIPAVHHAPPPAGAHEFRNRIAGLLKEKTSRIAGIFAVGDILPLETFSVLDQMKNEKILLIGSGGELLVIDRIQEGRFYRGNIEPDWDLVSTMLLNNLAFHLMGKKHPLRESLPCRLKDKAYYRLHPNPHNYNQKSQPVIPFRYRRPTIEPGMQDQTLGL